MCAQLYHNRRHLSSWTLGLLGLALFGGVLHASPVQISYDQNGNPLQSGPTAPGAPVITSQAQYALAQVGGQASFSVVVSGAQPIGYQWFDDSSTIMGATNATLYLQNLTSNQFGNYTVVVTNGSGSVTSAPAALYLDSNKNGLPDVWELAYFGTLTNAAYAIGSNGLPIIDYFLAGANPTNSATQLVTLSVNAGVEVQPQLTTYAPGTSVTLSALPSDGLSFSEWSDGLAGAHNPASLVLTSNTTVIALYGSPGLDPNWTPVFTGDDGGVYKLWPQPDGKMIVAGRFSDLNGRPIQNIARLNPDGTVDTNFLAAIELGTTDNSVVEDVALQPDGKILLAGQFSSVDYQTRAYLARLNPDGSVDPAFNPGAGPNSYVYSLALLSDGRIVIGGQFSQVDGVNRGGIAILTSNGSLDSTFTSTNGFNNAVYNVAVQTADRILAGGPFTQYGTQPAPYLVRLNTNAILDTTFNSGGAGPNNLVQKTLVLSNGSLFCVGQFNLYNSTPGFAVLLDANGNPQATFTNTAKLNAIVRTVLPDLAGGYILGGSFSYYGSSPAQGLVRFNADGTFDPNFNTANSANRPIYSLAQLANGVLFVGGEFSTWSNTFQDRLIALNATNASPISTIPLHAAFRSEVTQTLLQSNGTLLVGGAFVAANGASISHLARLTAQGTIDPTFITTNNPNAAVNSMLVESDGSYVVGGSFGFCGNLPCSGLAHFSSNGLLDTNFQIGTGFNGTVYALANQPGLGILVGGSFTVCEGTSREGLVRLQTNGLLDNSFIAAIGSINPGSGASGVVYCMAVQPDGKILIGGEFGAVLGVPLVRLARLLPDGEVDTSFNTGAGMDGTVNTIALQPNGEILIGGNFNYVDNLYRPRIARLLTNGAPDITYPNNDSGPNGPVWQLALQADNSVWLVGDFSQVKGIAQNRCAHLLADGSVDPSFNPGFDLNDNTYTLSTGTDGSVYLGGWVRQMYSHPRAGLLRLVTSPGMQVQFVGTTPGGLNFAPDQAVLLVATAQPPGGITGVEFESSPDGVVFTPVGTGFLGSNSQWTATWQPALPGNYFLRAVATGYDARQQASPLYGPLVVTNGQSLAGYAAWVDANFSPADQTNPSVSGEFADPYHTGLPNWVKFAIGTSPSSAVVVSGGLTPSSASPIYPTLTYTQNLAATTIQFTVQVSSDLATWSGGSTYTSVVSATPNANGTQTVVVRSNTPIGSAPVQFLRLLFMLP
jgi:uncharacterized delta-60 repeat protein